MNHQAAHDSEEAGKGKTAQATSKRADSSAVNVPKSTTITQVMKKGWDNLQRLNGLFVAISSVNQLVHLLKGGNLGLQNQDSLIIYNMSTLKRDLAKHIQTQQADKQRLEQLISRCGERLDALEQ